jgi:hypothetical protein
VGSKSFTESVILGELASQLAQNNGAAVVYKRELGGSRVLWNGLLSGEIDLYPEYTGTLIKEILAEHDVRTPGQLEQVLSAAGISMSRPLGFNNTYAIGMREDVAERLGITRISDLKQHPELRLVQGRRPPRVRRCGRGFRRVRHREPAGRRSGKGDNPGALTRNLRSRLLTNASVGLQTRRRLARRAAKQRRRTWNPRRAPLPQVAARGSAAGLSHVSRCRSEFVDGR